MKIQFLAATAAAAVAACSYGDTVLSSYNFNSFTLGNLGTDLTGTTAGQGGWYTYCANTTGSNGTFSIVADPQSGGTRGQSLKINGGTGAGTNSGTRFAWTSDVANNIGSRGAGEDQFVTTFDMYMGGAATSKNRMGAVFYDSTGTKVLSGVYMQADTGQLYMLANYNNAGTIGNYAFSLGTGAVLSKNTWYSLAFTFDSVTGRAQAGFYNTTTSSWQMYFVDGAAAGTLIDEMDLYGATNSSSGTNGSASAYYDNITVTATPAPGALALLGVAGLAGARRRR